MGQGQHCSKMERHEGRLHLTSGVTIRGRGVGSVAMITIAPPGGGRRLADGPRT